MSQLLPALLISLCALVVFLMGALHLLYTFRGTKLHPRDPELLARLQQAPLSISRQTSMWKAWIGFNASHSFGALLFGSVYGYLAIAERQFLWGSPFLLAIGLLTLAGYAVLAFRYWFRAPLTGILLATVTYAAALLLLAFA